MSDYFYITTPIYYVNDAPHIGHAYTSVACDVLARFWRERGKRVFFLTGTDEHGRKVAESAAAKNMTPQELTDKMSSKFRDLHQSLHVSHDDFIRTTEMRHKKAACHFWRELDKKGYIKKGVYRGWYSVRDENYISDDSIIKHEDGRVTDEGGNPLEYLEEESFFFPLSQFEQPLLAYYRAHKDSLMPESRYNEVVRFIEGGLKDLSISRKNFSWGIDVPEATGHVMYVWIDALVNYLSAIGYPKNHDDLWPVTMHVIGKDIVRFHAVYWIAMLMALELPLPQKIVAHGWWTHEGEKISKSRGNVVDPLALIDQWGVNALRYFLLRAMPFGNDGDFSQDAMVSRVNGDLANGLGNLCQRVLRFIERQGGGVMPRCGKINHDDKILLAQASALPQKIETALTEPAFHRALDNIWELMTITDRFIDAQAPWKLKKSDPERMEQVLWVLMQLLAHIMSGLHPFMPDAMDNLRQQLGMVERWDPLSPELSLPEAGHPLPPPQGLFPRWNET